MSLAVTACCGTSSAAEPPDRRFGVMTHFAHGWDPVWADIAAMRGVTTVRDELYWDAVEREKGVFAFSPTFDRYMEALRRNDIAPLIVLSFENRNYDNGDTPYSSEAIGAFARYGVQVLKRYGTQIKSVEVWNEYNGTFCKGPAADNRAPTYTRLLKETYAQLKTVRPDVTVLGGATAGVPLPYWEKLMQQGALNAMDALSIHPYRYETAPEGIETEIAALQTLVRKYNGGATKPIWVTEVGWATQTATAPGGITIDETTQAKYLARAYALLLGSGVERVYWYLLRDYEDFTLGLTTADARPKLAAFALQVLARELAGAQFVRRDSTPSELYSLLFARPSGEKVRVTWALKPIVIPTDGATRIVDLEGREIPMTPWLTLGDAPVLISGDVITLPAAPLSREILLADSVAGFSGEQGAGNWSYGERVGADPTFRPLSNYTVSDWNAAWGSAHPYLSITAADAHPSTTAGLPVTVVRRWTSDRAATLRVSGEFRCGTNGDGVGVAVLVNGNAAVRRTLGGGNVVSTAFDFECSIAAGDTVEFTVNPGPGTDISYDATRVTAQIHAH